MLLLEVWGRNIFLNKWINQAGRDSQLKKQNDENTAPFSWLQHMPRVPQTAKNKYVTISFKKKKCCIQAMKKAVYIPTCSSVFMYDTATQHNMPVHRQLIHSNVNNHRLAQIDTICTKHTFTSSANFILNMNIVLCYSVDVRKGTKKWCMNTCGNEWPNMLHTHDSNYSHLFHHPRDGHIKMHNLYDRPHWHDLQGRSWQLCPYFLLTKVYTGVKFN